jgi:hypothetical protein
VIVPGASLSLLAAAIWLGGGMQAGSAPPAAIPPPPYQETANCAQPTYATDHLVCDDPELRALDADLARRLAALHTTGGVPASPFIEDQGAWLRRRSLCAFKPGHRACALAAYRVRTIELEALSSPSASGRAVTCTGGLGGGLLHVSPSDTLTLVGPPSTVTLVALPKGAAGQPFATYRTQRGRTTIRMADGRTATCR